VEQDVGGPCCEQSGIFWIKLIGSIHYYPEPPSFQKITGEVLRMVKQAVLHHQPLYVTDLEQNSQTLERTDKGMVRSDISKPALVYFLFFSLPL
jgi:hypothetical protein